MQGPALLIDALMNQSKPASRLRTLTDDYLRLEHKLKLGGGPEKIEKIHKQGKLTARERIELLLDKETYSQEIALRNRVPIIYLVDSAGVNLPYQGGVFPGQYGAARIFYYNSIMRRYLKVPQISAVMGMCVAGGAYLPALSDVILMVEGTSFMGVGGANLVKGATGQTIDNETLGGALTHNSISGVAHFRNKDENECIEKIRELVSELPLPEVTRVSITGSQPPAADRQELYDLLPEDHKAPYDM